MSGPLPDPNRRRRNVPTIPTTSLPVSGRKGTAPSVPSWVNLGRAGSTWWRWAWATPQAAAWGTGVGQESVVARRASLEDDLAAIQDVHGLDFEGLADAENIRNIVQRVAALATGRLQLMREMRELDDRLGLTPKGMAALRWTVVADAEPVKESPKSTPGVPSLADRRTRLTSAS